MTDDISKVALFKGRALDEEPRVRHNCNMGVGCEESGVCYASANGYPERCGRLESATAPAEVEVDVRLRLMKTVAGNVVKDGVGACDALYSLATEHGAAPQEAAGFAHHVNGALALLEDDVAKACELTATLARQLAEAESALAAATRRVAEVEEVLRQIATDNHAGLRVQQAAQAALKEPK